MSKPFRFPSSFQSNIEPLMRSRVPTLQITCIEARTNNFNNHPIETLKANSEAIQIIKPTAGLEEKDEPPKTEVLSTGGLQLIQLRNVTAGRVVASLRKAIGPHQECICARGSGKVVN
jgi:hypothetical protein